MCEMSWVRVTVGPCAFSSPVTLGGSVWVRARAASSKGAVSSVPVWFRADSGTNLIKQGEIVTGRPCGSVAQLSVLAWCARGSGFETRSSHVLFSPVTKAPTPLCENCGQMSFKLAFKCQSSLFLQHYCLMDS